MITKLFFGFDKNIDQKSRFLALLVRHHLTKHIKPPAFTTPVTYLV